MTAAAKPAPPSAFEDLDWFKKFSAGVKIRVTGEFHELVRRIRALEARATALQKAHDEAVALYNRNVPLLESRAEKSEALARDLKLVLDWTENARHALVNDRAQPAPGDDVLDARIRINQARAALRGKP